MAKSELLEKIRDEFLESCGMAEAYTLDDFCVFAAKWLAEKGVVGVGYAASGLSLRFTDGTEIGLIAQAPPQVSAQTPAVAISTVKVTPRGAILGDSPSQPITGQ